MKVLSSDYPVSRICRVLDYARSSCYCQPAEQDEQELRQAIEQVTAEWSKYGCRRVTAQLRRQGLVVNSNRVGRIMREMGSQAKIKRRKRRTTNSEHDFPRYPNLVQDLLIARPDQVWVADITYVRLRSEFVYLAVIMDVYTRCIRGWYLSRSLDQELTLAALKESPNPLSTGDQPL